MNFANTSVLLSSKESLTSIKESVSKNEGRAIYSSNEQIALKDFNTGVVDETDCFFYHLLDLNEALHEAETKYLIEYYRDLTDSINGTAVMHEDGGDDEKGIIGFFKKIFRAIGNFFKTIWNWITGKSKDNETNKLPKIKELAAKLKEDESKTIPVKVYHYPNIKNFKNDPFLQAVEGISKRIEAILGGNDNNEEFTEEGVFENFMKGLSEHRKPNAGAANAKTDKEFQTYINENITWVEDKTMNLKEFKKFCEDFVTNNEGHSAKYAELIKAFEDRSKALEKKVESFKNDASHDAAVKDKAKNLMTIFSDANKAYASMINAISGWETKATDYILEVLEKEVNNTEEKKEEEKKDDAEKKEGEAPAEGEKKEETPAEGEKKEETPAEGEKPAEQNPDAGTETKPAPEANTEEENKPNPDDVLRTNVTNAAKAYDITFNNSNQPVLTPKKGVTIDGTAKDAAAAIKTYMAKNDNSDEAKTKIQTFANNESIPQGGDNLTANVKKAMSAYNISFDNTGKIILQPKKGVTVDSATKDAGNAVKTYMAKNNYSNAAANTVKKAMSESASIHGEPFNSDTLFDNEDYRDFNPTTWLDVQLKTESYALNYEIREFQRRVALQEAVILSDENPLKYQRLIAMREAEESRLQKNTSNILAAIKKALNLFLGKVKDTCNANTAFVKKYKAFIDKPIKITGIKSTGDILAGKVRIRKDTQLVPFNSVELKDDLVDAETFFKNKVYNNYKDTSSFSKRNVTLDDAGSMKKYLTLYFGGSGEGAIDFETSTMESDKNNILDFIQNVNMIIARINNTLDKIELEMKRVGAEVDKKKDQPDNKPVEDTKPAENAKPAEGEAGKEEAKTEGYYSILYGRRILTELTSTDPDKGPGETGEGNTEDIAKMAQIYLSTYSTVLTTQITCAEFVTKELMDAIIAHVKSYMTPEQIKAADFPEKPGQEQKDETAQAQTTQQTTTVKKTEVKTKG